MSYNNSLQHENGVIITGNNKYVTLDDILPWSSKVGITLNSSPAWETDDTVNSKVSLWKGDITTLKIDCIVNAAKNDLKGGGAIDGAIHKAAGKELLKACLKLNGCNTGDSKLTHGFDLPAKYVIHTVGPKISYPLKNGRVKNEDEDKLKDCYNSCLMKIVPNDMKSIAFCCISTGVYAFPNRRAAEIALSTTRLWLQQIDLESIDRIIFCVYKDEDLRIYEDLMSSVYFPNNSDFIIDTIDNNLVDNSSQRQQQKRKHEDTDNETLSTPSVGRKKKKKKQIFVKESINKFMLFSDLQECADKSIKIHYDDIKSDVNEKTQKGFFYKQSKNVTINYIIDNSERKSIRLNNLLERGFPSFVEHANSILERNILDNIVEKCDQAVQITKVSTDVENQPEDNLVGPWEYKNSSNVTIAYIIDNNASSIRLDNLIERGFPESRKFQYYSFLQFKNYCQKMGKTLDDVKDDESTFMSILCDVSLYYASNPECACSQEIGEFNGPQSYEDRNIEARFFYYGAGKIKFYRRKDLYEILYKDYGQVKTNQFLNNPGKSDFIAESAFVRYLHEINENISRNKRKYHGLFVPYSGPQCYEDVLVNPERLQYDVNYKTHTKREVVYATPKKDSECDSLLETFLDSRFSLRVCENCDEIRILGKRAAKKYPLCFYEFDGKRQFLKFNCENLFDLNCESEKDLNVIDFENVQVDNNYVLYAKESNYLFGHLIQICEIIPEKKYAKFNVVRSFGSNTWIH